MVHSGCQESIDLAVYLDLNTPLNLNQLKTSEGCITHSKMSDSVAALEDLVSKWCQQIEKVKGHLVDTIYGQVVGVVFRCWQTGIR